MREVKFRAWDSYRNEWFENFVLLPNGDILGIDKHYNTCFLIGIGNSERYKKVQFTGLKDNSENPQEIFDGDILHKKYHIMLYGTDLDEWVDEYHVVEWNEEYGGFYIGQSDLWSWMISHGCAVGSTPAIKVGNKYEHPHLLEATK